MSQPANTPDLAITFGVGALAVIATIAKGAQWQDPHTGKVNIFMLITGIATALVLAALVRAGGVHFGVEPWAQVAASGVLCYVGPDSILKSAASMILSKFGVKTNGDAGNAGKP